jgi:lysozyme family protein
MTVQDHIANLIFGMPQVDLFLGTAQAKLGEVDVITLDNETAADVLYAEFIEAPEFEDLPVYVQTFLVDAGHEFGLERAVILINSALREFFRIDTHVTGELTSASRAALTTLDASEVRSVLQFKYGQLHDRFAAQEQTLAAQA